MKIAYFDCFSGISGNMILGALLDAGLELEQLEGQLASLGLDGFKLVVDDVRRSGIRGTHVEVAIEEHGVERHLHDIREIITRSELPEQVKAQSLSIFGRLAEAEARVHGEPIDHIHFHEVGALDAIVDVVGSVTGLWLLGIEQIYASHVHVGCGTVECAHGTIPLPAPATAELLRGVPIYGRDVGAELVTPTGAAILTTLANSYGSGPAMRVAQIGYGAGTRQLSLPNLLRVLIGETVERNEAREQSATTQHHGHDHAHEHHHDHEHAHPHEHTHPHDHTHDHEHDHSHAHPHDHEHEHDHDHGHAHEHDHDHPQAHVGPEGS